MSAQDDIGAALHVFITAPGFEQPLAAELGGADGPRWPAVVSVRRPVDVDPAFARQCLPQAHHLHGGSARELAEAVYAVIEGPVDAAEAGFSLHVFVPDPEAYRSLAGRVRLVADALEALLRERRRRAWRRLLTEPSAAQWPETLLVQVALVGRGAVLVSAARPKALATGGTDLAPWPAGLPPVPEDRAAPSRAYRKLVESLAWLGERPSAGHTCVDLGGSPGGWAWTALQGGAHVVAVDRSPLAPPAAGHPRLEVVLGNAFTYRPNTAVDWLLCDVICEPARTIALVDAWMGAGLARRIVATIKFKGVRGYGVIDEVRTRLGRHGWRFLRIKHMANHHNEVVVLARQK